MLYIDKKYAGMVSSQLERFKWKDTNTAEFRCPQCGDSKKSKTKCRGGFYALKDTLMVGCFNCSYNKPFGAFLKAFDPIMYKEYIFEKFKYNNDHRWFHERLEKQEEKAKYVPSFGVGFNISGYHNIFRECKKISELDNSHHAKKYIMDRMIPFPFWDNLYYTDNFKKWINESIIKDKFKDISKPDPRIIIPFMHQPGGELLPKKPFAYQGRYIGDNKDEIRYISINPDKDNLLLYGVERLETGKQIYVVEGPFDSMFLPNAIAVAGSGLQKILKYKKLSPVFIFDNEPRNPQVVANMQKVIDAGKDIVIWPSNLKEKDINQMVLAGKNVLDIIGKNTYNKTIAKLKITQWSKL